MVKELFRRLGSLLCLIDGHAWHLRPDLTILSADVQKDGVVLKHKLVHCERCNKVIFGGERKLPHLAQPLNFADWSED